MKNSKQNDLPGYVELPAGYVLRQYKIESNIQQRPDSYPVYLAKCIETDKKVVIKSGWVDNEFRNLKRINHPNVVKAYEVFGREPTGYLVLEHIEGLTLNQFIKAHAPIDEVKIKLIFKSVTATLLDLRRLFDLNIYELKGRNMIVRKDLTVCLIDFENDVVVVPKLHTLAKLLMERKLRASAKLLIKPKKTPKIKIMDWAEYCHRMAKCVLICVTGNTKFGALSDVHHCSYCRDEVRISLKQVRNNGYSTNLIEMIENILIENISKAEIEQQWDLFLRE